MSQQRRKQGNRGREGDDSLKSLTLFFVRSLGRLAGPDDDE